MRKILIFFLIFIVLAVGATVVLNLVGIIDLAEMGTNLLLRVPLFADYLQADEEIEYLELEISVLEEELEEAEDREREMQFRIQELEEELAAAEEENQSLEDEIDALQEALAFQEDRMEKMIDIYGHMDPERAAAILENLGDRVLVPLMMGLDAEQAAGILSNLPPDRAANISGEIFDQ